MKTFDDLVFKDHPNTADGLMCQLKLGDYTISVVTMKGDKDGSVFGGLYGSQPAGTYEVAVFGKSEMVPLSCADDVVGWQSPEQITHLMAQLQADDVQHWEKVKSAEKKTWQEEHIYSA